MDLYSIDSKTSHGFNANIAIDRKMFKDKIPFTTEAKAVEGMPDVKWYLQFWPVHPKHDNRFGIYLWLESEKKVQCKISGFALTLNEDDETERTPFCVSGENGSGICFKEERIWALRYNFFDENGKYQIEIQVSISYKNDQPPKICNPTEWGERLQENSDKDFNILVGDETFAIHKFLIAAESTVFKRMFEDKFKEAEEGKVTITDFNVQAVKAFVDYCSGRDISTFLQDETDEIQLLYFADKYDSQTLKPQLEKYFASKLSKENISLYVSTSDKTNALELRQACVQFVRNLLYRNDSLPVDVFNSFDQNFMVDVLRQALNVKDA